jgi:hypothetical protein
MGVPALLNTLADTAAASGVVVKGFRQERVSSVWACAERYTVPCWPEDTGAVLRKGVPIGTDVPTADV